MQYAEDDEEEDVIRKWLAAFFGFSSQSSTHIITSTLETFYHKSKMQVIRASVRSSVTVLCSAHCRTQNVDCTAHYMCVGNWLASLACLAIFKFNAQKIDSIRLELVTGDRNGEVYLLNSGCKKYEISCRFVLCSWGGTVINKLIRFCREKMLHFLYSDFKFPIFTRHNLLNRTILMKKISGADLVSDYLFIAKVVKNVRLLRTLWRTWCCIEFSFDYAQLGP